MKPFITADEVVANASLIVKETSPKVRNIFKQWVYLGERQLGYHGLHEKVKEDIEVSDLFIKKPKDYAVGIDMALYDDEGKEILWHYQGHSPRIHEQNSSPAKIYPVRVAVGVSEGPYGFDMDSRGENIKTASIRYYSYPLSAEGEMLIPEHHINALMMYLKYMWALRENRSGSEIAQLEGLWTKEQRKAKTKNKMPSMLEARDIVRHHMTMINKIFYEKF